MQNKPADVLYCNVDKHKIERAQPTLNRRNLLYLYQFIKRRYAIHIRKDVLNRPAPWTKDPVLQKYRFTNVRREHDRETKWVIEHITSNSSLTYSDKLLNVVLFRLFNRHETAELLSMPIRFSTFPNWNPEWYRSLFEAEQAENPEVQFFTGAFYTSGLKRVLKQYLPTPDSTNNMAMRVMWFMYHLIQTSLVAQLNQAASQKDIFDTLCSYDGIANFLAYQIFVDMTYIPDFPFSENEFTVAGIGCLKGLDYLFEDKDGMSYEECLFWLRDNLDQLFVEHLGKDWDAEQVFWDLPEEDRHFNVMSLENCCCELSKYIRAKTGAGRPRKLYRGGEV